MSMMNKQFLPMTVAEMKQRGWNELDVLLITGDAYVDHPSFGAAVIGRVLEAAGWRVGLIAQPDWTKPESLSVMGRPRLFCGITAGNLDSMLSNYTAARRKRKEDAYSENGEVGKRPNMASVVYTQLAKQVFPKLPIVLGGLEASMRRTVHYDYWQDKLRPSILSDAKADLLIYGMGEHAIREIAQRIHNDEPLTHIPGTARLLGGKDSNELDHSTFVTLPSFEECKADKSALIQLSKLTEREQNPFSGKPLVQWHGARALYIAPPARPLSQEEFDAVYALPFARAAHPTYKGEIPAFKMIGESVTVVRGCGGGCSFCGLGLHQGRFLSSRSEESIEKEVLEMVEEKSFHGTITDLGGPTANLYGCHNGNSEACHRCKRPSCLYPNICPNLELDEDAVIHMMQRVRGLAKVKHVFIQSGIRMDVALRFPRYIRELAKHYVSGHLKVAPEHMHPDVLDKMRKPGPKIFEQFIELFDRESRAANKNQYIVPYFISNFPGCTSDEMNAVEKFVRKENWKLQQVQDFIPLPMTVAAAMYYSGLDYQTGEPIEVIRGLAERRGQMRQLRPHQSEKKGPKAPNRKRSR
jgi:uncharacterized radical SAM protein YgiQ